MYANVQIPLDASGSNVCCGLDPEQCECVWTGEELGDAVIAAFFDAAPIDEQYRKRLEFAAHIPVADEDPNDGYVPSFTEYGDE